MIFPPLLKKLQGIKFKNYLLLDDEKIIYLMIFRILFLRAKYKQLWTYLHSYQN